MAVAEPGCVDCPPGSGCIPCTTGKLKVTVYLQTLCWDTNPAMGEDTPDPPLIGAWVYINGPTDVLFPLETDANGEALFEALAPGAYDVSVVATGFVDATVHLPKTGALTADVAVNPHTVKTGHVTEAIRVLRRKETVCQRKHGKKPPGAPGSRSISSPVFWSEEPWPLVVRDVFWVCFLAVIAGAFVAPLLGGDFGYVMAAWAFGYASYLTAMIFGELAGYVAIIAAAAVYALVLVIAISQAVAAALGIGSPPSPAWFALLNAEWAGFACAYAWGRTPQYFRTVFLHPVGLLGGFLGLMAAIVAYALIGGSLDGIADIMLFLLLLLAAFVCGLLAALCAHAFKNEGAIDEKNAPWVRQEEYLLPYSGEHYCVQGYRGFISHGKLASGQEYCYDWEFPLGMPILCAREGHITKVEQTHDGQLGYEVPLLGRVGGDLDEKQVKNNEIHVLHRDRTTAQYLHLRLNGVSEIDPGIVKAIKTKPLHVYGGQRIAAAGSVGVSMHPHLHFTVVPPPDEPLRADEKPSDYKTRPAHFQDPDTARHGFRCFTFRKYLSSNLDCGNLKVTPDNPPFNPGGIPTDGKPNPNHDYFWDP